MARRKSKPLLPHEVISNFYSGQGYSNIAPSSSLRTTESSQRQASSSQESTISSQTTVNSMPAIPPARKDTHAPVKTHIVTLGKATGPETISDTKDTQDGFREIAKPIEMPVLPAASTEKAQDRSANLTRSLEQTFQIKRRPGYFANRRSASFMIHDDPSAAPSCIADGLGQSSLDQSVTDSSRSLKRTTSQVRLSLSLNGKAEVTTSTGETPSPPHPQRAPSSNAMPRPNVGLQRSHSALEPTGWAPQETNMVPFPSRPMTGRSRDSRTWEFYCDSDARNALTEQAEREERGSATAAISLIRSCSQNKKAMSPNPNKRNAHVHAQKPEITKRLKADSQRSNKSKPARATSSVARLETTTSNAQKQNLGTRVHKKSKSGSQTDVFQDENGDSDKENWEPGTQTSNPRRRKPADSQQVARILEESLRVPSQSASLDALMHRETSIIGRLSSKSSISEEKENSSPSGDDEVAAFMGESAPREVEDLDCVQNLLSLSQAAWR